MSDTLDYPSQPLAVLVAWDGSGQVIALDAGSPLPEIRLPRREPLSLQESDPSQLRPADHVFRLTRLRAPDFKWWRVYNEGRSRTSEPAYVYLEQRS